MVKIDWEAIHNQVENHNRFHDRVRKIKLLILYYKQLKFFGR